MTQDKITSKIAVLSGIKDDWYSLHTKLMNKSFLDMLDIKRVKRCRVEITMIDNRINELKSEYISLRKKR